MDTHTLFIEVSATAAQHGEIARQLSACGYLTELEDGKLIYTMEVCRVQAARERKGMPFHPCKGVGVIEYSGFAREIDRRIQCECLSCYPEVTDDTCSCKWAFSIPE